MINGILKAWEYQNQRAFAQEFFDAVFLNDSQKMAHLCHENIIVTDPKGIRTNCTADSLHRRILESWLSGRYNKHEIHAVMELESGLLIKWQIWSSVSEYSGMSILEVKNNRVVGCESYLGLIKRNAVA